MFETYVSIQQKVPITIILPSTAHDDFQEKIVQGFKQVKEKFQALDANSSVNGRALLPLCSARALAQAC